MQLYIFLGDFINKLLRHSDQTVTKKTLWFPFILITSSPIWYTFCAITLHAIPAIILDLYFKWTGSKMRILPIYRKAETFKGTTAFALNKEFDFKNPKTQAIYSK